MLVEDTLLMCAPYITTAHIEKSEKHRAKTFYSLVLRWKMRKAVWLITERDTGGVLYPIELCTKTGERVMEVLRTKHPEACPPTAASLELYPDRRPEIVPVDITDYTVTEVVGQLSVGA